MSRSFHVPSSESGWGPLPDASFTPSSTGDSGEKIWPQVERHLIPLFVEPHCSPSPMFDTSIVCATCAQLSYERMLTTEGQIYHKSWTVLTESAARGCRLCSFFIANQGPRVVPEIPWQHGPLFLRIKVNWLELFGYGSVYSWAYGLCLSADIDEPLPAPARAVTDRTRYPDRGCDTAIGKVRTWINECETKHQDCRKFSTSSLPSRVLDLYCGSSSQIIGLVEGKGLGADYVTLSYCWGKEAENTNGQISICTSQNINQLFQGISIDVLPPLYRDAVIMTRRLGKRYLWIDSLCIMQDSHDDWSKECPRMADIYANSFLTISAASCQNKQEGFIKATMFGVQAKLTTLPDTQSHYIYVRPFNCPTPPTPLIDRAWAFQERLLSSRVLHLTSLEMVFQCDQRQSGGCGNSECPSHGCGRKSFLWDKSWPGFDLKGLNDIWYRAVEGYAHLELTYETDRLPALSGIARILQQRFAQQSLWLSYVAGLWDNDLPYGLLWSLRTSSFTKTRESSPYIAPTWSWASVRGPLQYLNSRLLHDPLRLKIVDVQARLSTSNPFGEISSASLIVDAPIGKFCTRDMRVLRKLQRNEAIRLILDTFAETDFAFDAGNHGIPTSETIWLLPCMADTILGKTKQQVTSVFEYDGWHGLVLELVDEREKVFKRIGVFSVHRLLSEKRTWRTLGFVDKMVTII